ncbi:ZIP family metal transporter [Patescibacteria group bacterium]|nr:ZIP family metal transporter [Patescibacteria group bacterium]
MVVFIALLTFVSTFCGGLFGLRHQDKLHLILGFTAGVLLGVVTFDIFPEIIRLTSALQTDAIFPMLALVAGFLIFHITEKVLLIHHEQEEIYGHHKHPTVGILSALALSGHSFLDGVGIGLGFQVSVAIGILVSLAVIAHDFSDGLNTVSLVLVHKNSRGRALRLLFLDALAPVLGALATKFFTLPPNILLLYLGFFAGFLLYIGAAEILPEAHSERSSYKTILLTILGAALIFAVTRLT